MKQELSFFNRWIGWGCLIGLLVCSAPAFSATITVNAGESIQAAINSASSGDIIVISAGTYEEDLNIGDMNSPGNRKDGITLKAADGANVEIKIPNNASRLKALAALGADFGTFDRVGFFIYGDNTTIEGFQFTQINAEVNNFNINTMMMIISSNVTVRNCEFAGLGPDIGGDVVALAVTPLDAIALSAGQGGLASNLQIENCTFHDIKYPYGNANFLMELGLDAPSPDATITNCEFYNNGTCINMDNGVATFIDCHFHDNTGTAVDASDDGATLKNCLIETSGENGIEISNAETEDDEAQGIPMVIIEDCKILNNGTGDDHNGIQMEHGTLIMKNTIIAGSSGANVFFKTETGRTTTATFDHCDIYGSYLGTGIQTPVDAKDIIQFTMTNSIVVDAFGIINEAGPLADITLDYCNIFASDSQFFPDQEFITATNILNANPQYTNPGNGDFSLQTGSPMATAGKGGTYMGSQGLKTSVQHWMLQ